MKITSIIFLLMGFTLTANAQTPKHTETVVVNGMDTYYEVYGEGPPLFFLHGGRQSSALWHEFVNDFTNNFEVYLVDLFGNGKSSPPPVNFPEFAFLGAAHKQFADLLKHLGIEHYSGVGFSMGAVILLQFAVTNPNSIEKIILIGHGFNPTNCDMPATEIGPSFNELTSEQLEQLRAIFGPSDDQIRQMFEKPCPVYFVEEQIKGISTETLIVSGELDRGFYDNPYRHLESSFQLHELMPNSHIWIVPNEGHRTFDGPGKPEFIRIANEFLNGEWE